MLHAYKGGLPTFAASAKSNWPPEERGRSGLLPSFFDVQTQLTAAKPIVSDAVESANVR
jgi:hypothetical protein